MSEASKQFECADYSTSVSAERNRIISWESTARELISSGATITSPKISTLQEPHRFVGRAAELILPKPDKLTQTLLKIAYEIAKFIILGLSSLRRFLFVAK